MSQTLESGERKRKWEKGGESTRPTIRMPHLPKEPHTWRRKRIILRKLQLSGKQTAFERCSLGSLNQRFPVEQVVFGDGSGGDAFWGIVGQGAVFLQQATLRGCGCHLLAEVGRSYVENRYSREGGCGDEVEVEVDVEDAWLGF
jgi:hypothetical protein